MTDFKLRRIGMVMEPRQGDPNEVEGVLNPAAVRARDGQLYLFPRLVAHGNYSRIGIARVLFDGAGDPIGVERMGIALEPQADYELSEKWRMRGSARDVYRAAPEICHDIHGLFALRPTNSDRDFR